VIARVRRARTPEAFALACLLVQIGRLAGPAQRRGLYASVWDAYGAAVPSRRARVLRALLAEAETLEASTLERSVPARLDELVPVPPRRPG
jgi:hypothetical protein